METASFSLKPETTLPIERQSLFTQLNRGTRTAGNQVRVRADML